MSTMTSIWVKVVGAGTVGTTFVDCDPSTTNVARLKNLVKLECSPKLDHVAALDLIIKGDDNIPIEEDVYISERADGRTKARAFIVEVPAVEVALPQQPVNRFTRIFDLLKKSNIDSPREDVIEKIAKSDRLVEAATFNTSLAYSTYTNVRDSAGSQTKSFIGTTLGMRINGSVFDDFPFILSAESNEGKYVLLKMLKIPDGASSLDLRRQDVSYEAAACRLVHEAIVPMERRSISIDADTARAANCAAGTIDVLVMPWYQCTLNKVPSGNRNRIATEGRKLLSALQYIHSEGFVHLDVKAMNIFISNEGAWYLGDFGSCKPIGQKITSSTFQFYFEEMAFAPAHPKHDFFMLLMLLLIEGLDNRGDYSRLFYETRSHFADYSRVMDYVLELVSSEDSLYAKLVEEVVTLFRAHHE